VQKSIKHITPANSTRPHKSFHPPSSTPSSRTVVVHPNYSHLLVGIPNRYCHKTLHHKLAVYIVCVFSDQDALVAAHTEQGQLQQQHTNTPNKGLRTIPPLLRRLPPPALSVVHPRLKAMPRSHSSNEALVMRLRDLCMGGTGSGSVKPLRKTGSHLTTSSVDCREKRRSAVRRVPNHITLPG
jgi:hypothetical protein